MEIRDAIASDWPLIYPFFSEIVRAGRTYAFPEDLSLEEARTWWMEQPPGVTVVAEEDRQILGSAKMGPNRPARGAHIATASFMVDPQHAGRGIGTALAHYVIDWARDFGYVGLQFNAVVETNVTAVRLWQSLGFEIIGTVPRAFDDAELGLVGLHVMHKQL